MPNFILNVHPCPIRHQNIITTILILLFDYPYYLIHFAIIYCSEELITIIETDLLGHLINYDSLKH